jgi:hypothetical protein
MSAQQPIFPADTPEEVITQLLSTPRTFAALVDHMPKDCTEWSEVYLELSVITRQLETELASLRAENDRLRYDRLTLEGVREMFKQQESRAEKAEAALATEREKVVDEIIENNAPEITKVNTHITAILARVERAEAECLEQARLLGMSGSREAELLGKLERAERALARYESR